MRVIICGSRHGLPKGVTIEDAVQASGFEVKELIHGEANGVDRSAGMWAFRRAMATPLGSKERMPTVQTFSVPDWVWDHLGKKAGPIRNGYMARYAAQCPSGGACIALPGGAGTRNMVKQAREHGLQVYLHGWKG